jgi:hypothetical protein
LENDAVRQKLAKWYWCGVFGELYGSAVESRFALDIRDYSPWINGGAEPQTVQRSSFEEKRLRTLRSRLSAAYKGVHALLMKSGAEDFKSGQPYDQTVFFDENVDIHHIFPEAWCRTRKSSPRSTAASSIRPRSRPPPTVCWAVLLPRPILAD